MSTIYSPSDATYWAAEEPDKIAAAVRHRFERYQQRLREEGRVAVWRISDLCYHGRNPDGGYSNSQAISFGGDQGEVAQLHVGHFRRHVTGQLALATSQRPAIEVTATSNDAEAISATQVARQIIDYDLDEGVEEDLVATHERALVYAEGYLVQTWDFHAGELQGTAELAPEATDESAPGLPDDGMGEGAERMAPREMPVREGAVRCEVRSPLDVARDLDLDRVADQPWYIVRTRVHRWELAARFPEKAETRQAILDAPSANADDFTLWDRRSRSHDGDSDHVHMLTLYHVPTDALPQGRLVEVVGEIALFDDPYPYDHCVVHRDVPSAELDRTVGYGDAWDLLALSQALDSVESGILSVADAGALVNWVAARGQKVDTKQLDQGLTLIEYDDDGNGAKPPGLMERPEVRDADFKLSEHYQGHMRTLSGQNAVVQGDPDANIKSGNFAALVASMAVQAINRQAAAYAALMRSVMTGRIKLYQSFATTERVIEITGRDKRGHVQSFSADRLKGVRRVKVELANPILRTLQGKAQIADNMLERYGAAVIPPERYFALLETGRLDDLDPSALVKHKAIARRENEALRSGQPVQVLITDHHECHIAEHLDCINDESVRLGGDPLVIKAMSAHLAEHGVQWVMATQTNPALLAATGQRPAPMPAPMGAPPGAPGEGPPAPGGAPQPPDGGPVVPPPPGPMDAAPQSMPGGADMPGMPSMPANPMTGEAPPMAAGGGR